MIREIYLSIVLMKSHQNVKKLKLSWFLYIILNIWNDTRIFFPRNEANVRYIVVRSKLNNSL